jgi:hypothetical protein
MKITYELKRYKNSNAPDFSKALKLYSDNIEPEYRTDTNEIIFWTDNFQNRFGDGFYILGFYLNGLLIGFTEIAYFEEEKLVEIDYLVIDKRYRKNNAFYQFVDHITHFLQEENIVYDYIICEVGCYFENREPTEDSKTLIRLLKMAHFGVIKSAYFVPRLGKHNYESQMRAILMMYSNTEIKHIKKETYLMMINALYYKYYQRWYNEYFNEQEKKEYKIILDNLFENIKRDIGNKENIEINGYHNLLPLNPTDFSPINEKQGLKMAAFVILFIICVLLIGGGAIFIHKKFEIDIGNQFEIITTALVICAVITTAFFENRSNFFSTILKKIIDKKG